jgi:hypothetical protein
MTIDDNMTLLDNRPDDVLEVYLDRAGEWRWRVRNRGNRRVLATSGEGYRRRTAATAMGERVTGRTATLVTR